MSESYPFRFETSPKKKGTCPQCGHTQKFRYYEDLQGNRLDDFGKCERINDCGYWLVPSANALPKETKPYTPPPQPVQIYPAGALLERITKALSEEPLSNFHRYAVSLGISYAHLAKWRVGCETQGDKLLTLFVHEDGQQRITNVKWFLYESSGKRSKTFNSFSLKQPGHDRPDEASLQRFGFCLYGEHLLDPEKKRAVMLVESEKTAVIAAWFYPEYDWLAVGSCNGLTDAKMLPLMGRRCYWLSDADKAGRDNSSINRLKKYANGNRLRYGVRDLFPNRNDGYDLADAIRDNKGTHGVPELLDEHQRNLIAMAAEAPEPVAEGETDSEEPLLEDEDLPWENQVGLPREIWYNKGHRKHFRDYGFVEYENQYWFATKRENESDDTWIFKHVSNFIIRALLLIESKSNPKRIYEVTNVYKRSKVIDLEPKQFTALAGFSEIIEGLGNFIFWGNKTHFIKIKQKLFALSKEAEEIKTLGYHPDGFYAFANGIQNNEWVPLDEHGYGIVEHGEKRYFLPALSKIYVSDQEEYQTQKQFIFKPGQVSFKEYAQELCSIFALNENGRIGLLFYITCLFRDIVFAHFRFFPHLYLFGPPQSGKSTLAWSTMYLFGEPRTPFMLNTGTAVAFYKHFAEFRNASVWFDEYKNSIDYARVQALKTAYDGAGHTKSDNTRDNRNKSIPVHSGCLISGQELPTADVALFTRCILLQFTKTEFTSEEKQRHEEFTMNVEQRGISHLTAILSGFREHFKTHFLQAFGAEFALLKAHFDSRGIDDRIAKNMAILLATYQTLKEKLEFPFTEAQLRQSAYASMGTQNALIASSKETTVFWKSVIYMYRLRQIREKLDYRLENRTYIELDGVKDNQGDNQRLSLINDANPVGIRVLLIRLQNMHTTYQKHCRERGEKSMDEGSLRHYLTTQKGFLGKVRGVRFGQASTTALAFEYDTLTEYIEDFSLDDYLDDEPYTPSKSDVGF